MLMLLVMLQTYLTFGCGNVGLMQRLLFGIQVISVAQVLSPVMNLDMKVGSSMLHWWISWQISERSSFWSAVRRLGMNFAAMRCVFKTHCSSWHINDSSNVVNGSLMILMHNSPNFPHISHLGLSSRRSPRPHVIIQWCSAAPEACVPLEKHCMTDCFIAIQLMNHVRSLSFRFTEVTVHD